MQTSSPDILPTVIRLESLADMAKAEATWRQLDLITTAPFVWFQSFEWCYNWMRQHGGAHCQPLVFMLKDSEEATALLPLMHVKSRLGLIKLRVLGDPHTQYANILTRAPVLDHDSRTALRHVLAHEPGLDQAVFNMVPEASALAQVLAGDRPLTRLANFASQLDLTRFGGPDAYDASVGKKTARNLRRAMRQLEEIGPVTLNAIRPADPAFPTLVKRCLTMKTTWLEQTGRMSSGLSHASHGQFLSAMQSAGGDGPLAFALMLGNKPIAIELGFLQRGHYYAYIGAFTWNLRNLSPGKLQMHMSIRWLIGAGVKTLDLLGNPADYKQHYANRHTALASYVMAPTLRGRIYTRLWTSFARPAVKTLFHLLPEPWRISMHVIRKLEYNFIA